MTSEATEKRAVARWLTELGAFHAAYCPYPYGISGMPDRVACFRGRFIAIEMKSPGKVPTQLQSACIEAIGHAGGLAFYATSLDEVKSRFYKVFPDLRPTPCKT
jgi:Holliday junction resolvase